jgi:2-keto-4-pentenoate hydratase/2-oxohepta-3-ene-1,7-dioic acid hydratase in catechol pathway
MKIIRVQNRRSVAPGSSPFRYGILDGDRVHLFPSDADLPGILSRPASRAAALDRGETWRLEDVDVLSPTIGPVSMRDNVGFRQHIRNTRASRGVTEPLPPEWAVRPAFYFANPWSIHAADAAVSIPPGTAAFDFEYEVGAIIGRHGSNLSLAEAHDAIAGYVLYCDWSARDIQTEERAMQVGQGKGKDAAISLGPWVLTADEADAYRADDGFDFDARVRIDGDTVVDAPFRGMDWTFEELVAYASLGSEIHPGDIVASGTVPTGCLLEVSALPGFRGFLQAGQVVSLDGGPLGEIRTPLVAPEPMPSWRRTPATAS